MNLTDMKHYRSRDWNFALDIPKRWNSFPAVHINSPYQVIRFASREDGLHVLIIFREPNDPKRPLNERADEVQRLLASKGFSKFARAEAMTQARPILMLEFDRPHNDENLPLMRVPGSNFLTAWPKPLRLSPTDRVLKDNHSTKPCVTMVDLDMRRTFNLALLALGGSVVAEALSSVLICITSRSASEGLVYRFCAWFHGPAEAVRFFFFSSVENHPDLLDDAAMTVAFFGTALLQWFLIFLLVLGLVRLSLNNCDARRTGIQS